MSTDNLNFLDIDEDDIPATAFTGPAPEPKPEKESAPARSGNTPTGPSCPDCGPDVHSWENKTKTGKDYYRCSRCKGAWWPDREKPKKLGPKWPPFEPSKT